MDTSKKYKVGGGSRELPRHTWGLMSSLLFLLVLGFVMTMSLSLPIKVKTTDAKGKKVERWVLRSSIRGCVGFPCPVNEDELQNLEIVETLKGRVGTDAKKGQWHPGDVKGESSSSGWYIDKFGDMRKKGAGNSMNTGSSKKGYFGVASSLSQVNMAPGQGGRTPDKEKAGSFLKRQMDHKDPPHRPTLLKKPNLAKLKKHGHGAAGKQVVTLPDKDGDKIPDKYDPTPNGQPAPGTVTLPDKDKNGIPDAFQKQAVPDANTAATQAAQTPDQSQNPAAPPTISAVSNDSTATTPTTPDSNANSILDTFGKVQTAGTPAAATPKLADKDKDGVPDLFEQGPNKDSNHDGKPDRLQGPKAPTKSPFDKDADGVPDRFEVGPNKDNNANGIPDRLETGSAAASGASAGAGKEKKAETSATATAVAGADTTAASTGTSQADTVTLPDANSNGIPDAFEKKSG